MVLHKLMLEPYLKRRFNEGVSKGRAEAKGKSMQSCGTGITVAWTPRRVVSGLTNPFRFSLSRKTNPHHQISIASPKL